MTDPVVQDYLAGLPLKQIVERNGLTERTTIYRRLAKAGVPPLRKPQGRLKNIRDLVAADLIDRGCVACGERDIAVLQHDHIDPATKSFNIAEATSNTLKVSTLRVAKELVKCRVLCANCHQTHTGRNWWRNRRAEAALNEWFRGDV